MIQSILTKIIFIFLASIAIAGALLFDNTKGFIMIFDSYTDTLHYVTELMTSGSDDNVIVEISFIPLALMVVFSLIFVKRPVAEYRVAMVLFNLIFFSFIMIEAGSVYLTIAYSPDLWLRLYFIGLFGSFVFLQIRMYLFLLEQKKELSPFLKALVVYLMLFLLKLLHMSYTGISDFILVLEVSILATLIILIKVCKGKKNV